MIASDLREWVDLLRREGELAEIDHEVDPHLEITEIADRTMKGGGPALIEAMTYRHSGHSRADPGQYRPKGELESWLQRDPLTRYRALLTATPAIIAGDLNHNVIWDKPGWRGNHATSVRLMGEMGLVSAYHAVRGEVHGRL